jgi:hypothetical protein
MCHVLEAPIRGDSQNMDYIKEKKNISQLIEKHMSLYSSVNRGIYRHVVGPRGEGDIYSLVACN